MKSAIFKIVLAFYSFMVFIILGLVHIFFPDAYFKAIEYPLWDASDPVQWEMVRLIGGGYVAIGLGGALVWLRPERNVDLFRVMLASGLIGVLVVAYTITIGVAPPIVWLNTVVPYSIMLAVMAVTYPWAAARSYRSADR